MLRLITSSPRMLIRGGNRLLATDYRLLSFFRRAFRREVQPGVFAVHLSGLGRLHFAIEEARVMFSDLGPPLVPARIDAEEPGLAPGSGDVHRDRAGEVGRHGLELEAVPTPWMAGRGLLVEADGEGLRP